MSVVEQFVVRELTLCGGADSQNQQFIASDRKDRSIFFAETGFEEKLAKLSIDERVFGSERVLLGRLRQ